MATLNHVEENEEGQIDPLIYLGKRFNEYYDILRSWQQRGSHTRFTEQLVIEKGRLCHDIDDFIFETRKEPEQAQAASSSSSSSSSAAPAAPAARAGPTQRKLQEMWGESLRKNRRSPLEGGPLSRVPNLSPAERARLNAENIKERNALRKMIEKGRREVEEEVKENAMLRRINLSKKRNNLYNNIEASQKRGSRKRNRNAPKPPKSRAPQARTFNLEEGWNKDDPIAWINPNSNNENSRKNSNNNSNNL